MDFVIIRTFQHSFPAHITLTKLKDAGIDCFLIDEFTVTVDPILSNAIGGIKLAVRKEDEKEATALLGRFDEEYRQNAACPKCGGRHIERVPKESASNLFTTLLTWLFGSYAISAENIYKCEDCGYESRDLPEPYHYDASDPENLN